jgi:16S rRNA G966 N2-methylase RsmD
VSVALHRITERCAIVYLDPPYASTAEYGRTLVGIGDRADELLTEDGVVVAEHARKMPEPLAENYGPLRRYRVLEQGDAGLSFYGR